MQAVELNNWKTIKDAIAIVSTKDYRYLSELTGCCCCNVMVNGLNPTKLVMALLIQDSVQFDLTFCVLFKWLGDVQFLRKCYRVPDYLNRCHCDNRLPGVLFL